MDKKKRFVWRYAFSAVLILVGALLESYSLGKEFLGFPSIGSWMIYVGFIMLAIITLQAFFKKEKIVDERMKFVSQKASALTFSLIIYFSFMIMILDGINQIQIRYYLFMSYFICGIILVHAISYGLLLRKN